MADAGWYPDPQDPGSEHYWDGWTWTGHRRPAGSAGSNAAPPAAPWAPAPGGDQASDGRETRVNPVFQSRPVPPAQPVDAPNQPSWQSQPRFDPAQQGPQEYPQQPWQQSPGQQGYPAQGQQGYPGSQGYPGQGQQGYPGQGFVPQPGEPWAGQPPAKKRSKRLLVSAGAVVVLVAAGLVTWLVWPGSDAPKLTYQGKSIKDSAQVLTTAETAVNKTVSTRHGAKSNDTRCYFVQPDTPAKGAKKSDVNGNLACGPVLFVDGDKAAEYLPVKLSGSTSSGKAELSPQQSLDGVDPAAILSGSKLARPDGKTAPEGNGGLSVPQPPAADKDEVVATSLGTTPAPAQLTNAVMVGRTRKVTVASAGYIPRYATGIDARSAPSGQKLLAFKTSYTAGEVSAGASATVKLLVDGASRDIPQASGDEYIVAAVPSSASVMLQLSDSGDTQTVSLPDGKPGADNIAVLTRTHRTALLSTKFDVPIALSKGSKKASITFHATASYASLDYWPPANESVKPSSPTKGYLSVRLTYTDPDSPGHTYGFDPALLRLKLPDGTVVKARNVAPSGKIANVFEVPASFTTGTVQVTGSQKVSGGVTERIASTKQFTVSLAAG